MYVSVLFSVLIDLSIIFLFDKEQCSVNVGITHVAGWLNRLRSKLSTEVHGMNRSSSVLCTPYQFKVEPCTTTTSLGTIPKIPSWLMYFVLRAPYSMHTEYMYGVRKGSDSMRNRMIDGAADPRANWSTDPACLSIHMHSDPNSPEGFPVFIPLPLIFYWPSQLTTLKEFRGMWYT